jgi:hypothetical protein
MASRCMSALLMLMYKIAVLQQSTGFALQVKCQLREALHYQLP